MIDFSGYNYLGLAGDPRVVDAAKAAIDRYGTSCSASRVVSGRIPLHAELEARIAAAYGTVGAVVTGSGYLTNAAVIGFVLGPKDLAVCDALVHNSIVAGTQWAQVQADEPPAQRPGGARRPAHPVAGARRAGDGDPLLDEGPWPRRRPPPRRVASA